jgi:hypothetical protein
VLERVARLNILYDFSLASHPARPPTSCTDCAPLVRAFAACAVFVCCVVCDFGGIGAGVEGAACEGEAADGADDVWT